MSDTTPSGTPDPFAALRAPVEPVAPDPAFAAALRARLEDALLARGGRMTTTTTTPATTAATGTAAGTAAAASAVAPEDVPYGTVVPYLCVAGAREAVAFYEAAFGARRRGEPYVMEDGRLGHAELVIGNSVVMLSDEFPPDILGPRSRGGWSVSIHLEVADVDATLAQAVASGATATREPTDNPYGRNAVVEDPFGHRWMLSTPPPAATPAVDPHEDYRAGDVGYAWLEVPDAERARSFFAAALGWSYVGDEHPVADTVPQIGVSPGDEHGLQICLAVADVADTVARVRAAGGTAEDPALRPYGVVAGCTDDQGQHFAVYEPPAGATGAALDGPSELGYLTIETPDSARAQAFYGAVFGWTFTPGRVDDGWGVEGIRPMTGLVGGKDRARIVAMFVVADVAAAVERVRAAGGTASDPERQPYGLSAEADDGQGTAFYLGQL